MNPKLADFFRKCESDVYPEPRSPGHDLITERMAEPFLKLLKPYSRILDIGCGQGPALDIFNRLGISATGITLSKEDVAAGAQKGHSVWEMDQNNMPESWEGMYHAVWARHVAEHSPIPFFTLQEYARVLKPYGLLYMEVPAPETDAHHEENPNHYSVFTGDVWGCLLNRAGFYCDKYQTIPLQIPSGKDKYFSYLCSKRS